MGRADRLEGMAELIDPRSQDRTLIIMRHGQADMPWGTSDFDRRLTEHGERQAHDAAHWLLEQEAVPEMIVCSAALRTRQTCTWVMDAFGEKAPTASLDERLYNAAPSALIAAINRTPETVRSLMLIAHCPGVQEAVLHLASRDSEHDAVLDASAEFSEASLAVLRVRGDWSEVEGADAELLAYRRG